MKDNFIFQNNYFNENDEEENNSFFDINQNPLFQKEDSSSNYFNNIYNLKEEEQVNNNNDYNNMESDFQYKNCPFLNMGNNLNKDFPLISPIPLNDDDSYKLMNNSNLNNNEIIKEDIFYKDGISSATGSDDTPLSTGGTGSKSRSKEPSLNNSNISNNKINNNNFISFTNEKKNCKDCQNTVLSKKRKQRIHLEDLNIDPEIIKYKKYQTIGDKVITSKNSIITDLDKKEIRAIRNRISAQKSRDRKKAEFLDLQIKLKYCQQQIEKQNMAIQHFEKKLCDVCKSKLKEIILENNNFNSIPMEEQNKNEKEYLVLDENSSILTDKKSSLLGKLTGALLALVCLLGIVLCVVEGGIKISYKNNIETASQLNIRQLTSQENDDVYIKENQNISNINITDEDIDIDINVPLPIKSTRIKNFENYLGKLQLYHDKFGFDIYSFLKSKKHIKKGFLMKKPFYNDSITDNSICFETKNIEHNNYIIDNSLKNTLPIEANNIVLDNNLSKKIISVFIKDYVTLQRFIDGRSLSLEEQIENEAKNSEDGCVYLQMIIPKSKITNYGDNETYYQDGFFEIRGKIFAYNNYYNNKMAASF